MTELLYKHEAYQLVGFCMEIHRELGLLVNFGGDSLEWKRVVLTRRTIEPPPDLQ